MCSQIPALQMLWLRYMQKNAEHIQAQVQKRYTEIRAGSGPSGCVCLEWREQRGTGMAGATVKEAGKKPPFFSLNTVLKNLI